MERKNSLGILEEYLISTRKAFPCAAEVILVFFWVFLWLLSHLMRTFSCAIFPQLPLRSLPKNCGVSRKELLLDLERMEKGGMDEEAATNCRPKISTSCARMQSTPSIALPCHSQSQPHPFPTSAIIYATNQEANPPNFHQVFGPLKTLNSM